VNGFASRESFALPRKFLASCRALSQDRVAMHSCACSNSWAHGLVAAVLFAAFSGTLVASVSPQLHADIHPDANRTDHVCAITLIASGSCEHSSQLTLISPPHFDIAFATSAELTSTWVKPLFLNAHIFAHAPPVDS
jgi:hypothetical protein